AVAQAFPRVGVVARATADGGGIPPDAAFSPPSVRAATTTRQRQRIERPRDWQIVSATKHCSPMRTRVPIPFPPGPLRSRCLPLTLTCTAPLWVVRNLTLVIPAVAPR